jgi:O-antigen ligase
MDSTESSAMSSSRASAISLGALAVGASAVILVALPYKIFDLDRYFVPKELALHLTALIAIVAALFALAPTGSSHSARSTSLSLTRTDTLLIGFLLLSTVSAVVAPNRWLAGRALAVSASGIGLFWVSLYLARLGRARALMALLSAAVTLAAVVTLLQAYGVESEFFSINRSPGGTLGNRNFVAHIAAIGIPIILVATLRARRLVGVIGGACAIAIVTAAIVLSRSRAAWVATALAAVSMVPLALRAWRIAHQQGSSHQSDRGRTPQRGRSSVVQASSGGALVWRSALLGIAAVGGVIAAIVLPNTLNWRSPSPYLDSVLGVTNYREGSGHGRVVQYSNTARLAVTHPLLGVGPGNWAVVYPHVASHGDPSLDSDDGMTANPWPSSDWAAFVSERGLVATGCLALAFLGLLVSAWRAGDEAAEDGRVDRLLPALGLIATVVALIVVGGFDAVLLLPAPSLVAWSILGTFAGTLVPHPATRIRVPATQVTRIVLVSLTIAGVGVACARSAAQVAAMALFTSATTGGVNEHTLEMATHADPGNYRIRMRLAEAYVERRSCNRARPQAIAARALYPSAPEPRRVLAICSGRGR